MGGDPARHGPVAEAGCDHQQNKKPFPPRIEEQAEDEQDQIRVELQSLTIEDFIKILTEPKSSLVKQYTALLETEGLKLEFTRDALDEVAHFAFRVNEATENIGARRLHTIMERVLDEISFAAPEMAKENKDKVVVDADYVKKMVADIAKYQDLSRYIL